MRHLIYHKKIIIHYCKSTYILPTETDEEPAFFLIMPLPVIGAALIYSICYMVMTGMEVMMTRMMDTRRFFYDWYLAYLRVWCKSHSRV